jgi:hypothetical protein
MKIYNDCRQLIETQWHNLHQNDCGLSGCEARQVGK